MTSHALTRSYSIKETAALTGLPASPLRYYEQVGVIAPISRGESSKHRVYDELDLDQLVPVSCLAATGMSVSDMRQYMANVGVGPERAADQRQLLTGLGEEGSELVDDRPDAIELGADAALDLDDRERGQGGVGHDGPVYVRSAFGVCTRPTTTVGACPARPLSVLPWRGS